MTASNENERRSPRRDFERQIVEKHKRKTKARQQGERSAWFGLGMFGLVGWSVAVPTLIGVAIGLWIDSHWPSRFSWTLMFMLMGLAIGCLNAWWWVQREGREPEE